jgi:molybdopterin/thiamine biosynthesis adenylyltransferase
MDPYAARGLSEEELEFYSRQIVLPHIAYDGQQKLREARACVVGVGGLGSTSATQLAAMGVGHLRLVDYDVVEVSNLQRQHLYDTSTIGYPKVEAAAQRLRRLNPHIDVEPLPLAIGAHNAESIISGMDVVVDGLDRMLPRYALNRACVRLGVPYVFGGAVSMYGNTSTILPRRTACLECFCGSVEDDALPSCSVLGVHPSILSLIASIQVSEAVRVLLGQEPKLAGKLLYCDLESLGFEMVKLKRVDDCPACGSKTQTPTVAPEGTLVTELCSRQGGRTFAVFPPRDLMLDMDRVRGLVLGFGFPIEVRSRLGITFAWGSGGLASLLASGILIVQGAHDEEEASDLYRSLVEKGLAIRL